MQFDNLEHKLVEFQSALEAFVSRISHDKNILAAVLVGSISEVTIWRKESVHLWIIEADGVTKRLKSDGQDERIWRTLTENAINIHAELIPRSRFKQMVEGSSRTAFSCNFFATRNLIYCDDPSIETWFMTANEVAVKDQALELMISMAGLIDLLRYTRKQLELKNDLQITRQLLLWAANSVAAVEIIRFGEVYEDQAIYRGIELKPELFDEIYVQVLTGKPGRNFLESILQRHEEYVKHNWESDLKPIIKYLKKQKRNVPLTEIANHFAHTQLYPWAIEAACEWLFEQGEIEKIGWPFKLTKKSRVEVEEPAYSI